MPYDKVGIGTMLEGGGGKSDVTTSSKANRHLIVYYTKTRIMFGRCRQNASVFFNLVQHVSAYGDRSSSSY